jgi:hypothetical protein
MRLSYASAAGGRRAATRLVVLRPPAAAAAAAAMVDLPRRGARARRREREGGSSKLRCRPLSEPGTARAISRRPAAVGWGFEGNVCPGQVTSTTQVLLIMYLHKIVICGAFCRLGTAVDRARAGSGSVRLSPRAVPGGRAAAVPVAARGGLLLTGQRVPAAHARLSNLRRR